MAMYFRGFQDDGLTFGRDIENSPAFRFFTKSIQLRDVTTRYGGMKRIRTCPARLVAAIMGETGWLVSEKENFYKIQIEGSKAVQGDIYIEYANGIRGV